jgi:hypothetical protein
MSVTHVNGVPIEPPTGALAELREQIDELALMAADVFFVRVFMIISTLRSTP